MEEKETGHRASGFGLQDSGFRFRERKGRQDTNLIYSGLRCRIHLETCDRIDPSVSMESHYFTSGFISKKIVIVAAGHEYR